MIFLKVDDILFIIICCILLFIFISVAIKLQKLEREEKSMTKARKDRIDLEAITKNIESNYRPINIELTSYEKEQENNAIISYDELVKSRNTKTINYDDSFVNSTNVDVKKVNLELNTKIDNYEVEPPVDVCMMSYEKEEAFLKALRQLQRDLVR